VDSQRHFYRFGAVGSPDIMCVIKGRFAVEAIEDALRRLPEPKL
jgi:hypothetical protein